MSEGKDISGLDNVHEIRPQDWGEGVVGPNIQLVTDGLAKSLADRYGLDESGAEHLASTLREHTLRVCQATQRALGPQPQETDGAEDGNQGDAQGDAEVVDLGEYRESRDASSNVIDLDSRRKK